MRPRVSGVVVVALLALSVAPFRVSAQVGWKDLVFTLGSSLDGYSGNFSAVTVSVVDTTKQAVAVAAELGARGTLSLYRSQAGHRVLEWSFDGGVRQAAAFGFRSLDYSPRELAGNTALSWQQSVGTWGYLTLQGAYRARTVQDRPPMPLFLQPGYTNPRGYLRLDTRSFDGVSLNATLDVESADYKATKYIPQLELLDRKSAGIEMGARWGGTSTMRFYVSARRTAYDKQGTFDASDPFRRDHTARVGLEWTYASDIFAQVGLEGVVNRSNSDRPEYDAVGGRLLFLTPLPQELTLTVYAVLLAKSYVRNTGFALLVPGEEADNASQAYIQLARPVSPNLDAAVRLGWTRAETNTGNSYYQRFGGSLQFNFRPNGG
jgi:hypothetical protein